MDENDYLDCSLPTSLSLPQPADCYRWTAELPEDFQMLENPNDCERDHHSIEADVIDGESSPLMSTGELDIPAEPYRRCIPSSFSDPALSQLSSKENKEGLEEGEEAASSFSLEKAENMMRRRRSFDPDRDLPESWTKKYLARLCRSPPPLSGPSSSSSLATRTRFPVCTTTTDAPDDDRIVRNDWVPYPLSYVDDGDSEQTSACCRQDQASARYGNGKHCRIQKHNTEHSYSGRIPEHCCNGSEGSPTGTSPVIHPLSTDETHAIHNSDMDQNEAVHQNIKTTTRRRRRLPDLPKQPSRQFQGLQCTGASKLSRREGDESVDTACPTSEATFNGAANLKSEPEKKTATDMSVESPPVAPRTFAHLEFHSRTSSPGTEAGSKGRTVESFFGGPELIQLYYNGYPRPVLVLRCQHCHPVGGYGLESPSKPSRSVQEGKDNSDLSDSGSVVSYETVEPRSRARNCPETPRGITRIARQETRAPRQTPEVSSSSPDGSPATSGTTYTSGTAPLPGNVHAAGSDWRTDFPDIAVKARENSERSSKDVGSSDNVGSRHYDDVLGNALFSSGPCVDSCHDEQTPYTEIDVRSDSPDTPLGTSTMSDESDQSTMSRSSTITSSMTSSGYGTTTTNVGGIFSSLTNCENISTHLDSLEPTHRALHRFHPRHVDELELDIGDPIYVVKEAEDLWCEGVNLRTGRQGIFPAAHAVDLDYSDFDPLKSVDPPSKKERFLVKYLGSVETTKDQGPEVVVQSVAKVTRITAERIVQTERNNNQNSATVPSNEDCENGNISSSDESSWNAGNVTWSKFQSQTCVLEVSEAGIRMVGNKKGTTVEIEDYFYPLTNISYCGVDPEDARFVGVITKHPTLTKFACHIFQLETSARPLASAVGLAFERFYQKVLENAFPIEEFYLE